jgi:hypothetical protein
VSTHLPRFTSRTARCLAALALTLIGAAGPLAGGASAANVTLAPTDGWDAKNGKTLVQDGKLYLVQASSPNDWFQVEAGHFLSLQFQGGIPSGATIQSVKVGIEHFEEPDLMPASPLSIVWQVGGGSLQNPTVTASTAPAHLSGPGAEQTVEWDLTSAVDTPAKINDLKLAIRNNATNGKKSFVDRAYVAVSYSEAPPPPSAPTITSNPPTTATVNQAYSYQAQASGTAPISWSLTTAPAGMTVNAGTGLVSWTPTASGDFPVVLRAQNGVGSTTQSFTIRVFAVPPQPSSATLNPTDGFDQKNQKTLVGDGKLYLVGASSPNDRFGVEAGYFLSLQFQGGIPSGATVSSVKLYVEHYEEDQFPAGALVWQAGSGPSLNPPPATAASTTPALRIGSGAEQTIEWDVAGNAFDTPAEVNALKLVIRNNAANGKKSFVDRAYVVVDYEVSPTPPTITSSPVTSGYVNEPYSYQAQATGTAPITWSLTTSPAGMTVNASTGLVSWTPTASGSYPVALKAQNGVGSTTQSYTVTVAAAPPAATVLAAGDIAGCDTSGDTQTAALLAANPSATILPLGDLAYQSGTAAEFANCYQSTWGAHKDRTRPAPGNHEYVSTNADPYFGYFGALAGPLTPAGSRGYYSFDLGAWHIVSLNSEQDTGAGGQQLAWLTNDLASTTKQCVLAYWHKPRFTAGNYTDFTQYTPFWNALYASGAEIVLNGHDHNYQRYRPMNPNGLSDPGNGIREFVVGTGGRSNYQLQTDARREAAGTGFFGVLRLTLRAGGYDWTFLPVAGQTYSDSGSDICR